jgi:hypothetical protein
MANLLITLSRLNRTKVFLGTLAVGPRRKTKWIQKLTLIH